MPQLLDQLASMENPTYDLVNNAIEELYDEPLDGSPNNFTGSTRVALDTAFSQNSVEKIITSLEQFAASSSGDGVTTWAEQTLKDLNLRSPTSLRIALEAVRRGKIMNLAEVLRMELGIATALLVRPPALRVIYLLLIAISNKTPSARITMLVFLFIHSFHMNATYTERRKHRFRNRCNSSAH